MYFMSARELEALGLGDLTSDEKLSLGDPGYNRYRKQGERHAITTDVLKKFHHFVKTGEQNDYEEYVKASLETIPITIKDLLDFAPTRTS